MSDCIFCKIASSEMESDIVYSDDRAVAFNDINPEAPAHILIIPKKHVASLKEAEAEDESLIGHLLIVARDIAKDKGIESGYRLILNSGRGAGQTVDHLHFHLLGGRTFAWPPG